MKKTVELLKNAGVIERLQKSFSKVKPPEGVSDERIRNELTIEYDTLADLHNAFIDLFKSIIEKAEKDGK